MDRMADEEDARLIERSETGNVELCVQGCQTNSPTAKTRRKPYHKPVERRTLWSERETWEASRMPAIFCFLTRNYRCSLYNYLLIWSPTLYMLFSVFVYFNMKQMSRGK